MECERDIYAEIAAGSTHSGELIEELRQMGRSDSAISRGIASARANANLVQQAPNSGAIAGPSHGGFGGSGLGSVRAHTIGL